MKLKISQMYMTMAVLMVGMLIGNIWNAVLVWKMINYGSRLSSVCGILFNFVFMVMFVWLYKQAVQQESFIDTDKVKQLNKLIEEYK